MGKGWQKEQMKMQGRQPVLANRENERWEARVVGKVISNNRNLPKKQ